MARGRVENVSGELTPEVFMKIVLLDQSGQPIDEGRIEHVGGSLGNSDDFIPWATESKDNYFFRVGKIKPGQIIPFTASIYTLYHIAYDWTYIIEFR